MTRTVPAESQSQDLPLAVAQSSQRTAGSSPPAASFVQLLADLPQAAIFSSVDGTIRSLNTAAARLFARSEASLVGTLYTSLYATSTLRSAEGISRFVAADGRVFDAETMSMPVRNDDGRVIGYLDIIKDVTRRVSSEDAVVSLHRITSDRSLSFPERLDAILRLGCQHFGLEIGVLSFVRGGVYSVVRAVTTGEPIPPGTDHVLEHTFAWHALSANRPIGFHQVGRSRLGVHACYERFGYEAYLGAPVMVDGRRHGTLDFSSKRPVAVFERQDLELMRLIAGWVGHEIARERDIAALGQATRMLEHRASKDELTALANRRRVNAVLEEEIRRGRRYAAPLCALMVDLDHFKGINDEYGHGCGDDVLAEFGRVCVRCLRDVDTAGRWGGEEFLIVLPNTDLPGGMRVAERLRQWVENMIVMNGEKRVQVTASVGVAMWRAAFDAAALVARADEALYAAKRSGRNRVVAADLRRVEDPGK